MKQVQESNYKVVVNEEGQYSIWLSHNTAPLGWEEVGMVGKKEECLQHIKEIWTDMTPVSLRNSK
jgi:MbtH protein